MPMLHMYMERLNRKFDKHEIKKTAKMARAVEPGRRVNADFVIRKNSLAYKAVQNYLDSMPGAVAETLRGVMHNALTSEPPKPVTFMWTPAYEFEISVTELGCGVMVHVKGRYPADKPPPRGRD